MAAIMLPAVLTMGEASAALERLQQAIAADAAPVLDAAALRTLDSSAVAVLLECRRLARAAGKPLQLVAAPTRLAELARLYGVEALIEAA